MILNHLIEIYAYVYISIIVHELSHYIVGRIIKLNIPYVHIGEDLFSIHIKKLYISPMVLFGSYVMFDSHDLINKKKLNIILFFLSGPLSNLMLVITSVLFYNISIVNTQFVLWINAYIFMENMFPFFLKNNDIGKIKKYLSYARRDVYEK